MRPSPWHILALGCALAACDRATPSPQTPTPTPDAAATAASAPPAAATVSPDEIARLEALGYVDVAAEAVEPGRSGVVQHDPQRAHPGYNLFTNAHHCSTQLIDMAGNVIRTWSLTPCFRWDNTSLLPDGSLLVIGREESGERGWAKGRYLARLGWDGDVLWRIPLGAHHDAQLTPRGQIAVLTSRRRLIPEVHPERKVKDDRLALLSLDGAFVEDASLYDLLKTAPASQYRFEPRSQGRGHLDLLHANSVFWMGDRELAARDPLYARQNVVVTIRHQDTVAVIDWDEKRVVWAWGQGELSGPHDAVVLDDGHFLVFDNGVGRAWSRVVEVDPMTREIVWQYRAPEPESFYTLTRGSSQRLPNGNTLIAESDRGRAFEVTPAGEMVWEFLNPNLKDGQRGALVRMRRVDEGFVRRLLAQHGGPEPSPGAAPALSGR